MDAELKDLPHDRESLVAMIGSLLLEGEQQKQRVEQQTRRAEELYLQNLRLQLELERYKKWYYGPRADRLATSGDVAQVCSSLPSNWRPSRSNRRMCRRRPSPSTNCGG